MKRLTELYDEKLNISIFNIVEYQNKILFDDHISDELFDELILKLTEYTLKLNAIPNKVAILITNKGNLNKKLNLDSLIGRPTESSGIFYRKDTLEFIYDSDIKGYDYFYFKDMNDANKIYKKIKEGD